MKNKSPVSIYNHLEEIILVILFAAMVAVIFMQVIMRYLFENSLSWSEEAGRLIFEWLTWIGMSLGARMGQHIKITLLTDKLPLKLAHALNIISEMIIVIICTLTILYGYELSKLFIGARFTTLQISLAWGYASVIAGCGLMAIRSCAAILRSVKSLKTGNFAINNGEGGDE